MAFKLYGVNATSMILAFVLYFIIISSISSSSGGSSNSISDNIFKLFLKNINN